MTNWLIILGAAVLVTFLWLRIKKPTSEPGRGIGDEMATAVKDVIREVMHSPADDQDSKHKHP